MNKNTEVKTQSRKMNYTAPELVKMGKVAAITAGQGGSSKDSTDTCIPVSPMKSL
jgi:hypothetical protein